MTKLAERLKSPLWRINHLYKIKDKQGNLITFNLNDFQTSFVKQRQKHRRNKVVKYRQGGFTTYRCIEMLDKALWVSGSSCAIIAHEKDAVTKIFEIVKRAFDNLPEQIKPKIKYDNKNEIQFIEDFTGRKLDSKIYVALKLRSGTVTDLHISESAFIKNRQELNAGSKQAVSKEGYITEETTANGFNEFYDETMEALDAWEKDDGVPQQYKTKVYFFSWLENPEYSFEDVTNFEQLGKLDTEEIRLKEKFSATAGQLAWRRFKIRDLGKSSSLTLTGLAPIQLFKQEYPTTLEEAFQGSGQTFFDQERVTIIEPKVSLPIPEGIFKAGVYEDPKFIKSCLQIFYLPKKGKRYVIGIDPSSGQGVDYACIDVWDKNELKQVAQWYGFIRPDHLAYIGRDLARFYNEAFVGAENNMLTTALKLDEIYYNTFKQVTVDESTHKQSEKLGWNTNSKTRPLMLDDFNADFEDGLLEINSSITKAQMRTFIRKDNGKVEHSDGKHDDALFGAFIALQMRKYYKEVIIDFV